jgi:hypothetical protein
MLSITFIAIAAFGGWWIGWRQGRRDGAYCALRRMRQQLGLKEIRRP